MCARMSHNGLDAGQVAPCRRCPVGRTGIDWSGGHLLPYIFSYFERHEMEVANLMNLMGLIVDAVHCWQTVNNALPP